MENKNLPLTEDIRTCIVNKFREGKFMNEICLEMNLSRSEIKKIIENYLDDKMISEDKTI